MKITRETDEDWWEVETLLDLCFAPGRTALSSYRLREDVPPAGDLCLVARDAAGVMGAIRFWPVIVGAARAPAMLLGPIAVHPTHQGEGLGAALIAAGLDAARAKGVARILLVGDLPYYARFGFGPLPQVVMPPPTNPDRVLGCWDWAGVMGRVNKAI